MTITRRSFLKGATAVGLAPHSTDFLLRRTGSEGPPNVVLIVGDDHFGQAIGSLNGGLPLTPTLDLLGAEGAAFTQAFATGLMCKPGRTSLVTSLYPHQHGVVTNDYIDPGAAPPARFLPQELKNAGYGTYGLGKWHCPTFLPGQAGFDAFKGIHVPWATAMDYIGRISERPQPWLLYLGLPDPHSPWDAKQHFLDAYAGQSIPTRPNFGAARTGKPAYQDFHEAEARAHLVQDGFDPDDMEEVLLHYYATTTQMDRRVYEILASLHLQGLDRNTLVVFTSDQGMVIHNHRLTYKGPIFYEEMMQIPLLFWWPGRIPAGLRSSAAVENVDVAPTILDLLGLAVPGEFEGASLRPVLDGEPFAGREFSIAQSKIQAAPGEGETRCLRTRPGGALGGWKLGLYENDLDELYDLGADPYETTNLAQGPAHAAKYDELRGLLLGWMGQYNDPAAGAF